MKTMQTGNPHLRLDAWKVASANLRRIVLQYIRLLAVFTAAIFAVLPARGEYGECGEYFICWGSFYWDVFMCGWNHVPSPDEKPGVGYEVPGCRMLFTELETRYEDGKEWTSSPCGDIFTVYRDDVAIATGLTETGGYQWFTDCDVEPGKTYKYEIKTSRGTTGPTNATCMSVYRANIGTNEVVFSADGGSRNVDIAIYTDSLQGSFYDPYALFFLDWDAEWVAADRKMNSYGQYTAFTVCVDENTDDEPRECVLTIEYEGFKWSVKVRQNARGTPEGDVIVAFDGNGGLSSVSSAAFTSGRQYGTLPTATRDGYRFAGWSTLADGGLLIGEESIVSKEAEALYAVWKSEAEPIWTIADGVLTAVDLNGATEIEIPDIVTSIATNVFAGRIELKSAVIPGNVRSIGGQAFSQCGLDKIVFAEGLVDIDEFAFWGCGRLRTVVFPGTLESVGVRSFYSCRGLKSINIPASLNEISQESFCQCPGLTAFSVAADNPVFSSDGGLLYDKSGSTVLCVPNALKSVEIPEGVEMIAKRAFSGCAEMSHVALPSSLTNIESYAFVQCKSLTSVEVPANVQSIGKLAFWLCSRLVSIDVAPGNAVFSSFDGCLYENGGKTLHSVPNGKSEVSIAPDVTTINSCAFYSCRKLASVTLPDTLLHIGSSAFRYCDQITSIVIPSNVTDIGVGVFSDCDAIKQVTILGALSRYDIYAYSNTPEDLITCVTSRWTGPMDTWCERAVRMVGTTSFVGQGSQWGGNLVVMEGEGISIRLFGGNPVMDSSARLYLVHATASAADIDLSNGTVDGETPKGGLKFPLTLSWAKGEIGEKVITIPTRKDMVAEGNEDFILLLTVQYGTELGEERVCTVTIHDPGYDELAAKIAAGTATKSEKSAWDKLQKAKAPYVRGLADPADGGKVSGSGLCAEGKKVTLKATANKNFTFLGWIDSPVAIDSIREQSTAIEFVATTASLVIDRTAKPAANSKTSTTITNIAEDVTYYAVFKSDPEVFVIVDSTDGIGAEPTGKGAGKYVAGTITGMGKYAIGKTKIALKATANKGYVFSGWYDAVGELLTKDATYTIAAMGEDDVEYTAKFITGDEDKGSITLEVDGVEMEAAVSSKPPYRTNVWAGVYLEWPVVAEALSATTVKVAGLPSGLKFAAKPVTSKVGSGKTAVVVTNVPANTIYGTPTAASKTAVSSKPPYQNAAAPSRQPYQVKVTVTTAGKSSQTFAINLYIDPLPAWAVGTFDGEVGNGKSGTVALTVAASGKISGKVLESGKTWALSAANFSRAEDSPESEVPSPSFLATVIGKAGKEVVTNEVAVTSAVVDTVEVGVASSDDWISYQNLWKRADTKAEMPVFKQNFDRMLELGEPGDANNTVKLTFKKDGVVSFAGKVGGASVSGTSQLVWGKNGWQVTLYAPPKGTAKPPFGGWCVTLAVTLTKDDANVVANVEVTAD